MSGSNLSGSNLSEQSPTSLLLAAWGEVPDDLCRDLMRYDAANHPRPESFNTWAAGGACPYTGCKWGRSANFFQKTSLWSPDLLLSPPKSALELAERLIAAKCVKGEA